MLPRRNFIQRMAAGMTVFPILDAFSVFAENSPEVSWTPLHLNHFPSRQYAFVFRAWDIQPVEKIARLLKTDVKIISDLAEEMGLPPQPSFTPEINMRNTLPTIYRLWDILPKEQMFEIIGMTYQEFYDFLHTDIALWFSLGAQPYGLTPLEYTVPTPHEHEKAKNISESIQSIIPQDKIVPEETVFGFIKYLNEIHTAPLPYRITTPSDNEILPDRNWSIHYPTNSETLLENSVKDFVKFCTVVMEEPISVEKHSGSFSPAPQSILLNIVPEKFKDPESHHVEITPTKIEIQASDARGIMRGLYFLEDEMSVRRGPLLQKGTFNRETLFTPRYVFSYYDMYGNMLKESIGEFYTETYLQYLSHFGINGIWLQCILSELIPSIIFPEFGKESKMEIERLNGLIERARKWGMNVYLYFNEPRGRTEDFYQRHPECRGGYVKGREGYAMCTSAKPVQEYLVAAFRDLFKYVSDLAGVFIITASENLTSCYSNSTTTDCPRCSQRTSSEVVAEVINLINKGVKMSKPEAEVIAWDWSWHNIVEKDPQTEIVKRIDPSVILMADFERGIKIKRGGIETEVNEYCLSVVGPSPRAIIRARQAQEKGTKIYAKLNLSTTCELVSIPYIMIPSQVARKFENLRLYGFNGAMESWGFGSYPSINYETAKEFYWDPTMTSEKAVLRVATRRYGKEIADKVVAVWEKFSESFSSHYPMAVGFIYSSPIIYGAARNLHFIPLPKPYGNTTIWNPKDDLNWGTKIFPSEIQIKLLKQMAVDWEIGLGELRSIFEKAGIHNQQEVQKDLGVVKASIIHFKSTANQIRFILVRNELLNTSESNQQKLLITQMENITKEEQELANQLYLIVRRDSRIGYDNYRLANILEKIINCQHILQYHIPQYKNNHKLN